jgi:tRNA-uridine 2-sulfurtransferase
MDMKKKLGETYYPEKEGRKKRLVIGLSGGTNSFVTAYLLKIQKYELIGVTVATGWEEYKDDSSKVLSCHLDEPKLEAIKTFCHQLGIPHFVVKANDEFKEEVVDSWLNASIIGAKANPCWNCHSLRMKLLHHKMVELDAQGMATGHLAKIFHQDAHKSVYVHSSNDELHDQSSLLSRLPHEILSNLMLPLSDLTQKEILKLAENFGLATSGKNIEMHECFNIKYEETGYLATHIPKKYYKTGELISHEKTNIGDHQGIIHYRYGEAFPVANARQNETFFISKYTISEKKIELAKPEFFQRKKVFMSQCIISEETPWSEPLKGVLKMSDTEFIDCWIYPKNNASAVLELDTPQKIFEGEIITIFKKKGKNSKVFLSGKVKYFEEPVQLNEEGKERVKTDYTRDF